MTRAWLTRASVGASMACIAVVAACTEAATGPTIAPGDDLVNDTMDIDAGDVGQPPASGDTGADSDLYADGSASYAPMLEECAACECSTSKGFCFGGGVHFSGAGDGAAACGMVDAGAVGLGCNYLPPACASNPTCGCVLDAIQTQFKCYLVCTPDNGYLLVYCPSGA